MQVWAYKGWLSLSHWEWLRKKEKQTRTGKYRDTVEGEGFGALENQMQKNMEHEWKL